MPLPYSQRELDILYSECNINTSLKCLEVMLRRDYHSIIRKLKELNKRDPIKWSNRIINEYRIQYSRLNTNRDDKFGYYGSKEKKRLRNKRYRLTHKDSINQKIKKHKKQNSLRYKEIRRFHYLRNRQQVLQASKEYRRNNKQKIKERKLEKIKAKKYRELGDILSVAMVSSGLNYNRLAKYNGYSDTTIRSTILGITKPSRELLMDLASQLRLDYNTLESKIREIESNNGKNY